MPTQAPDDPPPPTCPDCGAAAPAPYCARCGLRQPTADSLSLRHIVGEWFEDAFGLDGRLVRTAKALLFRPGLLTAEYLAGRRRRYVRPFQLFLIVNVIFLVLAIGQGIYDFTLQEYLDFTPPSTELTRRWVEDALRDSGRSYAVYETSFNANADTLRKGLIIILVPLFGLAAWALGFRQRRHLVPHLVFSVHVFAFYWLYVSLVAPPLRRAIEAAGLYADPPVFYVSMSVLAVYLFLALRRVHGQGALLAGAKTAVLLAVVVLLLRSYRVLLFFGAYALT